MKNLGRFYFLGVPVLFILACFSLEFYKCGFPLNDDWAYLLALKNLLETGKLSLCDWASSTQLTHIFSGLLFARAFGFDLGLVKLVNIIHFALFLVFFQKTLEEFSLDKKFILLAALTAAFSPLNLLLSMSFMTDITYLFWSTLALYLFVKNFKTGKGVFLWLALAASGAAFLTRQLGLLLPAAFILFLFLEKKLDLKTFLKVTLPSAAVFLGYTAWFKGFHGPTWASENYVAGATLKHLLDYKGFFLSTLERTLSSLIETGFFIFPVCLPALFFFRKKIVLSGGSKIRTRIALLFLCAVGLAFYAWFRGFLPYLENNLGRFGIGVVAVNGWELKESGFFGEKWFWFSATAAGVLSGAVMLYSAVFGLAFRREALFRFFFLNFLLHLGISMAGGKYFDRYLVNFIPFFILSAALLLKDFKISAFSPLFLLIPFFAVSYLGSGDYLAWNRAKWELAAKVSAERKVDPSGIVNGFDYNAWFNYEKNMKLLKAVKSLKEIDEWEWQKMMSYRIFITYNPAPAEGWVVVDKLEYETPLSRKKGVIYALMK